MSYRVIKAVLDGFEGSCSEKLCLVALAEWSDDAGLSWPSVDSVARRMGVSRSQAQRTLRSLMDRGVLSVVGNESGGAPGSTRHYQIHLDRMTGRADAAPAGRMDATPTGSSDATPTGHIDATGSTDATGRIDAREGPHPCTETGRMDATQTVIEPSKNRQGEADEPPTPSQPAKAITFTAWLQTLRESGEKAITDHRPTWDYAQRVGLPDDFVELAWVQFRRRYSEDPTYTAKRYRDWRQVFRNALGGNWFRLWSAADDGYRLTTVGLQAQREIEALEVAA